MPTECEDRLSSIKTAYLEAQYYYSFGIVNSTWLYEHTTYSTFNNTYREHVAFSIDKLYRIVRDLIHGHTSSSIVYNVPYYLEFCVGGGTFDMDTLLSTMLGAKFDQLQYFIGIEDAYRVALWNAPFNADFYAALARGFQKWP
jgi:hypothetical protein